MNLDFNYDLNHFSSQFEATSVNWIPLAYSIFANFFELSLHHTQWFLNIDSPLNASGINQNSYEMDCLDCSYYYYLQALSKPSCTLKLINFIL